MRKIIFKTFIGSMILLFCVSNLQAQKYTVLEVKGTVEMSINGKTWKPLKENDKLKADYQIKALKNSSVHITDSKWVYSYSDTIIVSVSNIFKQRKTTLVAMNERSGKRTVSGVVLRKPQSKTQYTYKVFRVIGAVEMSVDGNTWKLLENGDELEESYQIRLLKNSIVYILVSNKIVYCYEDNKTVSVLDIMKYGKKINSGK